MVTSAPNDFQTLANSTADDAAAEDDHRGRHLVQLQRLVAGDDLARRRCPGRAGSWRTTRWPARRVALVPLPSTSTAVGADQPAHALDEGDLAALHQALQALVEAGDDAVLVRVDRRHVDALEAGLRTPNCSLSRLVGDLGGVQQGLGRDAAAVQAGAAELVLLDQGDLQAQLGRAQAQA